MEQLRQQNTQKKNFDRILRDMNALSDSEDRKRKDNMIKDIKNIFR